MGGSASMPLAGIVLNEKECQVAAKQLFDKRTFEAFADSDGMVPLEQLHALCEEKTDVFLTHDWGKELGVDNHERVARVNEALKRRGLRTWFDAEKMEGNVKKKMISGIENACCIVAFITQRYMQKVDGTNAEDNCQLEFNYASRRKTARKMVPVVMEARMRDTSTWVGEVGMVLGGSLYVDMSTDDSFEARMDELYGRIVGVTGVTVEEVVSSDAWRQLIEQKLGAAASEAAVPAATAAIEVPAAVVVVPAGGSASTPVAQDELQQAMQSWIESNTTIVRKFVPKYVMMLTDAGVGSIDKLSKKLIRNAQFLHELGMDEDDADELVMAVSSRGAAAGRATSSAAGGAAVAQQVCDMDCKECFDLYLASKFMSKPGKDRLIEIANSSTDVPRSMVAKGFLAVCYNDLGGFYQQDQTVAAQYARQCFEYLKAHCFQPYEYAVAPSDIVQKPYSFGAVAAWLVGEILSSGIGYAEDPILAFRYVEVCALHDNEIGLTALAILCDEGKGTTIDKKRGMQLTVMSASRKFVVAIFVLAVRYMEGVAVEQDLAEAQRLFKEASDLGYAEAMGLYGIFCYQGTSGEANVEEGLQCLRRAAALGSSSAAEYMQTNGLA